MARVRQTVLGLCLTGGAPAAHAEDFRPELALGARHSSTHPADVDGLRLAARAAGEVAAAEVALSWVGAGPAGHTLSQTVAAVAHEGSGQVDFQYPLTLDRIALEGLVDLQFASRDREGWSGGPHLYGGVELALTRTWNVTWDGDFGPVWEDVRSGLQPGLALGVGLDAWRDGRVGLRLTGLGHARLARKPSYNPDDEVTGTRVHTFVTTSVELLVGL